MFRLVKALAAGACILVLPLVVLSCSKSSSPASPEAPARAEPPSAPGPSAAVPSAPAGPAAPAPAQGEAGGVSTPAAAPKKTAPGLPAEVIYTSGDVQAQRQGGAWSDLEIGTKLQKGDSVKVGAASECQLKLADLAVVSIRENTQVSVDSLALGESVAQAKLGLRTGTVLSKVKKLTGSDSYAVRTDSAVGGVRGTEFGVTVTPQGNTLVTVKDGTVAVLPAAYDPDEVRALSAAAPEVDQIAKIIETSAAPVRAGQELTVTPQQAARAEKDFQVIRVAVARIVKERQTMAAAQASAGGAQSTGGAQAAGSSQTTGGAQPAGGATPPPSAAIEAQMKSIQAATATLASLVGAPRVLTPANEKALQRLEALPAPGTPAGRTSSTPQAAPAAPVVTPVRIAVTTDPPDSEIEIDGKPAGTGSYAADVNPGDSLTFVIRHEGYATKTLALTAKGPANYPVRLDPAPIEGSFAAGSAPLVGAVQASGDVLVSTDRLGQVIGTDRKGRVQWKIATQNTPNENSSAVLAGATLYFTGAKEFIVASAKTGQVAGRIVLDSATTHLFGQRVAVSGSLGVYPTSSSLMVFDPATGAAIRQIPVAGGTLMTPAISGGRVLVVSQPGVFLAADPQSGQVLFQVPTGASQPVAGSVLVAGTRAFFADRKGLVVCVDLQGRKVLWKASLKGSGSKGVFQDLEKSANGVFVFAGDTIYAFSASDGSELFPPITGASTAPLDRDGRLYFGTRNGTLAVADDRTGKTVRSLDMKTVLNTRPQPDGPRLLLGGEAGQVFVVYPGSIQ